MATSVSSKHILITGATGKVGSQLLEHCAPLLGEQKIQVRALCHNRVLEPRAGLEVIQGSLSDRSVVRKAMVGITHVVHLATCKETPDDIMNVAIKGLFWLLEECRVSATFRQFILVGGDAAVGHYFYPHQLPVTEQQRHSAYPGCYALSKVLEEVMLEQYFVQYDLVGCCLRAPWIMEKDDFKCSLSFGEDVFGGPRWRDLVGEDSAREYVRTGAIPVMLDAKGMSIKRNFVHVTDVVAAIVQALDHPKARQATFNICMDEPVDYRQVADYLHQTRNLPPVEIRTTYSSTWLDNAKAKFLLDWRPSFDWKRLVEEAWSYERKQNDPRRVWYPG